MKTLSVSQKCFEFIPPWRVTKESGLRSLQNDMALFPSPGAPLLETLYNQMLSVVYKPEGVTAKGGCVLITYGWRYVPTYRSIRPE